MFSDLFSYDTESISPVYREKIANILRARSEMQRASAEIADLRGRAWVGEKGLEDIIELKAADMAGIRANYVNMARSFLKSAVDVDKLESLLPMLALAAMQTLRVPLPILGEALGLDFDSIKEIAEELKKMVSEF